MSEVLSEKLFVPVILRACEKLLKENANHRLYRFLKVGDKWRILPQHTVEVAPHGWSTEDKATIDRWLARKDSFRAFMFPDQLARFKNPFVDVVDGKLVIRSGKKKITPLE